MKATPAPYPAVKLTFPGPRQVSVRVHVLVAEAFLPPRPTPAHEVRHWDGDRMNNAATNLRWGTRSDNVQDALRHGTHQGGLAHVRAWLTDDQVKEARAAYEAGATVRELADKYDAGWTTMWRIVTRRSRI
jgi:hypothetical protein